MPIGPIYCETPAIVLSFPAEPINTISNLVIIAFGIWAYLYLSRNRSISWDLYALAGLLTLTGIGSLLWHGLRQGWALAFDVMPGLLFLILFSYLWSRRLFGVWRSATISGLFFMCAVGLSVLSVVFGFSGSIFFWPAICVIVFGSFLGRETHRKFHVPLWLAVLGISSAILAFIFRTIDLSTCSVIPFGTHFLWHIFLSLGAFLCILFLHSIDRRKV